MLARSERSSGSNGMKFHFNFSQLRIQCLPLMTSNVAAKKRCNMLQYKFYTFSPGQKQTWLSRIAKVRARTAIVPTAAVTDAPNSRSSHVKQRFAFQPQPDAANKVVSARALRNEAQSSHRSSSPRDVQRPTARTLGLPSWSRTS